MKRILCFLWVITVLFEAEAQQNVGIGTSAPHAAAKLEISSDDKGFLPPRISSAKKLAIANPPKGLIVFDNNTASYWYYTDGGWKEMQSSFLNKDSSLSIGKNNTGLPQHNMPSSNGRFSISTDTSGYIYDSGGPAGNYSLNENRELQVSSVMGDNEVIGVRIKLEAGLLENQHDTLFILDRYSDTIKKVTGIIQPETIYLNGSFFSLISHTDGAVTESGFQLRFDFIYTKAGQVGINELSGLHFLPSKFALRGGFDGTGWKNPDSLGLFSLAYGRSNTASQDYSISLGDGNISSGRYAFSMGLQSVSRGFASIAVGFNAIAQGNGAIAMGNNSKASAGAAISLGENNTASGQSAAAFGSSNFATGTGATAFGKSNLAGGNFSLATGNTTTSNGFGSATFGGNTTASGQYAVCMGFATAARPYASLVAGRFNASSVSFSETEWIATDPLFILGNGTGPGSPNNAMTVYKNGDANIDGEIRRTATGVANVVPICYGSVSNTAAINSGTGNFTVTNTAAGQYEITINGQSYSTGGFITTVTVVSGGNFRVATSGATSGNLSIRIFNQSGTLVNDTFHFVVYKQ